MRNIKAMLLMMVIASAGLALVGCKEKGPAEKLGEKVDDAGRKAGDAAEDAGKEMKKAVE